MQKIRVDLGERSYSIVISENILKDLGTTLLRFEFSPKLAVVSNPVIFSLYGKLLRKSIKDNGFELVEVIIPDGEEFKSLRYVEKIFNALLKSKLDRKSALIALGGGVIGDITGFVASTYMRGIDFVQVPTTLLAQVDSSVGGKTGVNHPLGKNMIGTFWQPRLVWIDVDTLKTLPKREFLAGLAEVIKYGVIRDAELFEFLEKNVERVLNLDKEALKYIIKKSCEIKAEVVSKDERESGLRAILNFGHTIGHAIETVTSYTRYLHGEAIAIGMCFETMLARKYNLINDIQTERIKSLITAYGLPCKMPEKIDLNSFFDSMQLDKKAISGELTFILPEEIGNVRIHKGATRKDIEELLI